MTRLSDQIDNDNDFGLGHWSETDTQYSDARSHDARTAHHPRTPQHSSHRSHGYERLGVHWRHYEHTSTTPSRPTPAMAGVVHSLECRRLFLMETVTSPNCFWTSSQATKSVNGDAGSSPPRFLKSGLVPLLHERTQDRLLGPATEGLWLKAQERCRRVHDGPIPLG